MSISDNELSVQDAMPIELVQISYTGNYWYYTSGDTDRVFDGRTYRAIPFTHAEIEPTVDASRNGLEFTFPRDVEFGEAFRVSPPSEVVSFSLLIQNYLVPAEYVVLWRGRIINVDWKGSWMNVTVENVATSLMRPGLRRRYSTTCPYPLYGPGCKVPRDDWREISPVIGVAGISVIVQAAVGKPDNYYAGGLITYTNAYGGNVERRMIRQSIGETGTLVLASNPLGIAGGALVSIYSGCDHTIATCHSKFGNKDNCGATPYIPTKNPFGGSTVY